MPVLIIMDIEGGTVEQYDHVDRLLGGMTPENAPPGLISHTAGVTDTGIFVADVWESPEAMQQAFEAQLGPALAEAGVPEAQPQIVPVHNHLHGVGEEAGVIVIVEIDGMTTDDYDHMVADMTAHFDDGGGHPAVSHVAGASDTGLVVVDVWGSEEEFGEFAQSQIAPRAGDRMGAMTTRFAPVHKHVPVKTPTQA
jgi:hypothetical protein